MQFVLSLTCGDIYCQNCIFYPCLKPFTPQVFTMESQNPMSQPLNLFYVLDDVGLMNDTNHLANLA